MIIKTNAMLNHRSEILKLDFSTENTVLLNQNNHRSTSNAKKIKSIPETMFESIPLGASSSESALNVIMNIRCTKNNNRGPKIR